jgi:uncharacterized membrane protein YcfT
VVSAVFYAPGDWLGTRFSARTRRAFAAWALIAIVATMPLRYPYRSYVSLVWALSEVALVLALLAVCAGETPVEAE